MPFVLVELTGGNIRNQHIYLAHCMSLFPNDVIGGPNDDAVAPREIEIHYGAGEPIRSDIAGDKKIFRRRTWVTDFLEQHNLSEGDWIVLESTGPYRIHVYPRR
jgi:hypothetical protein